MATLFEIPARDEVPTKDRWDLSKLFPGTDEWETAFAEFRALIGGVEKLRGTLGVSVGNLAEALAAYRAHSELGERLTYFADLRLSEDGGDSDLQARSSRMLSAATEAFGAWSWLEPELHRVPDTTMRVWLDDPLLRDYRVFLLKVLRFKPHVLSEAEERLLALQAEKDCTAQEVFSLLTNVDISYGELETEQGPRPLSQSSFSSFMRSEDRDLRRRAFSQFYAAFDGHKNALAQLYSGSCKVDQYRATVRSYPSCRAMALFPDNVPESVYDNLVSVVGDNLACLHEYYELRRRALGLDKLKHYDVYVPIVPAAKARHPYDEAVDLIVRALAPLGDEYASVLRAGLVGGWVDRYENKGKRSGAFSAGSYHGDPYILMNYKEDVVRDMFTLAHEGGHSMHSYYSVKSNPYLCYNYTIFEAEVASTFNEHLLFRYLYERADSREMKAYLINARVDDLLATLYRQTMFAEFEHIVHAAMEAGSALTVDFLRAEYGTLLRKYFGPAFEFEATSDLECLRIPHFYEAFYVYKYATGVSASIALADRVMGGGAKERSDYFAFLQSGGSRFPIESLKVAGVDMSSPEPVKAACAEFARLVGELASLLGL